MKQTITKYDFEQAFRDMGRSDNFSYQGLNILYDFFEQYEEETGQPVELDVIAICCEWSESTIDELINDYGMVDTFRELFNGGPNWRIYGDREAEKVADWLNDETLVAGSFEKDGQTTFVYAAF